MYNTTISAKAEHFQFILDISDLKIFAIGECINLFCCRNETVINSHNAAPEPGAPAAAPNICIPTNTYHLEEEKESAVIFKPRQVPFHKSLLKKTSGTKFNLRRGNVTG